MTCACALLGIATSGAAAWSRDPQPLVPIPGVPLHEFEGDVPPAFRPDPDSHLTLNHRYYRGEGDTSLRWDWDRRGSSFDIRCPGEFPGDDAVARPPTGTGIPRLLCERTPVFSAWLYSESPRYGMLEFQVRGGDEVLHRFFVSVAFAGWQELRIPYPAGLSARADTLRIIAPDTLRTGTLYFDLLSPWRDVLRWQEYPRRDGLWPTASSPDASSLPGSGRNDQATFGWIPQRCGKWLM